MEFPQWVKDRVVEGGGELIGSNHPTWVSYASEFDLEFLDVIEDERLNAPIMLGGKALSEEEGNALWKELDAAASRLNSLAEGIPADEPWKAANAEELDRRSVQEGMRISSAPASAWARTSSGNSAS